MSDNYIKQDKEKCYFDFSQISNLDTLNVIHNNYNQKNNSANVTNAFNLAYLNRKIELQNGTPWKA